jgi:glutathione S-transferase
MREDPMRVSRLREGWTLSWSAGHFWPAAGQVVRFLRFVRTPARWIALGAPIGREAVAWP